MEDITAAVRTFAQYQAQAAEFSVQKLQEVIGMTSSQPNQDTEPVDTSLRTFGNNFGITSPVSQALVPVKRLGLNGATNGRYFEYPQLTASQNDMFFCDREFVTNTLAKVEACIGVGIYSLKLTFVDGT